MAFKATTATWRILDTGSFKYALGVLSASVGMFAKPGAVLQEINGASGLPSTSTEKWTRGLSRVSRTRRPTGVG